MSECEPLVFTPIGVVRSPFTTTESMPIQPIGAVAVTAEVVIDDAYAAGLADLDGFSHIYLLYHFHRSGPAKLRVVPFLDTVARGVFATRAPSRPNPIGLSLTRLIGRSGNTLYIAGVDILDATPVLDIKPYVPALEPAGEVVRIGWMEGKAETMASFAADARFAPGEAGAPATLGTGRRRDSDDRR